MESWYNTDFHENCIKKWEPLLQQHLIHYKPSQEMMEDGTYILFLIISQNVTALYCKVT